MAFESFSFLVLAVAAVALLRLCSNERQRGIVLCVASAIFVASFASRPMELLPLGVFMAAGYGAVLAGSRLGRRSLVVLLGAVIAAFVWLKQYAIIADLPHLGFAYTVVGLSYLLFRILHLIIAAAQGAIQVPGVLSYFNYALSPFTLVAGPVQRYQDFSEQMARPPVAATQEQLLGGLGRVTRGYFYLLVLSEFTRLKAGELKIAFYTDYAWSAWLGAGVHLGAAALVYFVFLYLNFSGYMHVMVGFGRLAGFTLPENFDEPYKAANFLEFWSRWHITVSEWLRTYLFNPLLKALVARWGKRVSSELLAVITFFFTFFVMGMWHGTSIQFLVCGLMLAIGATVNKLWQTEAVRRLGRRRYRALRAKPWYVNWARAATLAYMALVLVCVWFGPELSASGSEVVPTPQILSLFGLMCSVVAFLALLLGLWAAGPIVQGLAGAVSPWLGRLSLRAGLGAGDSQSNAAIAWTAAKVFAVATLAVVLNWSPEVVYKGF